MIATTCIARFCWIAALATGAEPHATADVAAAQPITVQSQGQVDPQDVPVVEDAAPAEPVGGLEAELAADPDRLQWHIPDPTYVRKYIDERLPTETRKPNRRYLERMSERIDMVARPRRQTLTLEDTLRRAMEHNLAVRVASYNPAIDTAQVVEAEAAFDAAIFFNLSKNKQNIPVASSLLGSNNDTLQMAWGITKLLPTGMQATTGLNMQRQFTDNTFQELNPAWTSAFSVELRQPLLRGFGIDFNRSFITVAKLDRRISDSAFRRQVITTLLDVENAYWDLVQARGEIVISGRLLADFAQIYDYLEQRRDFDAYKIQIADTKARLERTRAAFIRTVANVRNAEDRLIALMNDPELNLADDVELIPLDFPSQSPVVLDRLSEVQTALDHRPELFEAQLRVKQAKIGVGQAKNQALPQLDLTFRYTVDGLGPSAHDSFSEVTKNDFHEYFISIEFQWPIGNRGRRAQLRQATLQHSQAIASLKQAFEGVIFDVNVRVRNVQASYDQIQPIFESVEANEDQHEALVARAESKNFLQLNQELNALQSLASTRRELLQALIDFNLAITELEQSKGTLPEYNNVLLIADEQ